MRAEQSGGISPTVHSVLAVLYYFKGTSPQPIVGREQGINKSGVDFWHAVEFSRNGRFLCTHPLGLSSGLPFDLAFPTLPDRFRSVSGWDFDPVAVGGLLPIRLPSGSLSASPTLSEVFGRTYRPLIPEVIGKWSSRIQVLEKPVDFHCRHRACPALGNCSNLPPHSLRVNGSCGAKRRLAARPVCPHIRQPWVRRRCARPRRGRPSRRPVPLDRRGHRRMRGRSVRRRHRS